MEDNQLIEILESKGIITQQDTNYLVMRSSVNRLLSQLQQQWPYESKLESGGHYFNDSDLVDIYFIYDMSVYDASTAIDEAKRREKMS